MTFQQLKDALLVNARQADVCGAYQDILIANNEQDIITAGLPLLEWAYRTGILTDGLLNEFDEPTLNANGVYRTGVHVLNNPVGDLYFLGNSSATINLSGTSKCKIFSVTSGVIEENLADSTYIVNKIFSGLLVLTQNDKSISCNEMKNSIGSNITLNDETVAHVKVYENNTLNLNTNNDAFVRLQGFYNSITNGNEASSQPVVVEMNQTAQYNTSAL
jgi:hypothetical protein